MLNKAQALRNRAATCAAVLVLFLGALRETTIAIVPFGLAVVCALCAITAFTVEMMLAGTGIAG